MLEKHKKLIEELSSDRERFNSFVYTPLKEAFGEIDQRRANQKLDEYLQGLSLILPEILQRKNAILFRHIATPNYEIRRFIHIISAFDGQIEPLILEYTDDLFNNRNECKFYLGKFSFYKGKNKNNDSLFEHINTIDINTSNNQPLSTIKTLWGQSLVDFHHELFFKQFPDLNNHIFNLSEWLHKNGHSAKNYYKLFLTLFLKHGILFENFLLDGSELPFTKEVILPAILEITEETGHKPLIIALEPTMVEGSKFWQSHMYEMKQLIEQKMKKSIEN